jgi:hypothetical protein
MSANKDFGNTLAPYNFGCPLFFFSATGQGANATAVDFTREIRWLPWFDQAVCHLAAGIERVGDKVEGLLHIRGTKQIDHLVEQVLGDNYLSPSLSISRRFLA